MTSVLDASAAIEVVLNRTRSDSISSILDLSRKTIAPDLYKAEITSAIWQYLRAGKISKDAAIEALDMATGLIDEYVDLKDFTKEALLASHRIGHSTYDMFYLLIARRTGSTLLTFVIRRFY